MRKTLIGGLAALLITCGVAGAQTPSTGTAPKAPMPPAMTTNPAPAAAKPTALAPRILDVNSATKAELMALPGIGEARSDAIIKNRPYRGKDDIVSKAGVPQATYDKLKDQLIAKQK